MITRQLAVLSGLVFLLSVGAGIGIATPVSFHDQTYTTLDQLDQALEEGDISYDEYLLLMESFLGSPYEDAPVEETVELAGADTLLATETGESRFRLSYHGSLQHQLKEDPTSARYDRFACEWGQLRLDMSFELRNQGELLFRSRSLRYRHSSGEVTLGSYNLRLGQGVTQGLGSYHTELHEDNDFGSSLRLPIKDRHNGLLIRQRFGNVRTGLLLSDVEGAEFYQTAVGSFLEIGESKRSAGVVLLRQQIGRSDGNRHLQEYLAPYFRLVTRTLSLSGESSFGLGSSSAHVYEGEIRRRRIRQEFTFFSYARDYRNLQSGGYAYSDYDELAVDAIGFSYRDKRAGRIGLAASSTLEAADNANLGVSLVRWNSRLDGRHCVAANASVTVRGAASKQSRIVVRGVWENLDLTAHSSNRRLVSLSTRTSVGHAVTLETLWKLERRVRSGTRTSPASVRTDLLWQTLPGWATTLTLKYYSPNTSGSASDYLHFALGQKLTHLKTFSLWIRTQTKYLFDRQRLDVWQARLNCEFSL